MTSNAQFSMKRGDDILVVGGETSDIMYDELNKLGLKDFFNNFLESVQTGGASVQQTLSIPVTSIEYASTTKKGSTSWKVKGGWAEKYGITCYEETIEAAGIPVDKLKMDEPNIPKGEWTAFYDEWEEADKNGEMAKRRKVTKLVKA
jgi:hypothetical protein